MGGLNSQKGRSMGTAARDKQPNRPEYPSHRWGQNQRQNPLDTPPAGLVAAYIPSSPVFRRRVVLKYSSLKVPSSRSMSASRQCESICPSTEMGPKPDCVHSCSAQKRSRLLGRDKRSVVCPTARMDLQFFDVHIVQNDHSMVIHHTITVIVLLVGLLESVGPARTPA